MNKEDAIKYLEHYLYVVCYNSEMQKINLPICDATVISTTDESGNITEYTFKGLLKIAYSL